jgi:DNA-binding NarL/FixJ family response regulator
MTSVLIIDDHPIVLQGCRRMLEDAGDATRRRAIASTAATIPTW